MPEPPGTAGLAAGKPFLTADIAPSARRMQQDPLSCDESLPMTGLSPPSGQYAGALPDGFVAHLGAQVAELGRSLSTDGGWLEVAFGTARVRILAAPGGLELRFLNAGTVELYQLRELALYLLDRLWPEAAAGMVWHGFDSLRGAPPNFHTARLAGRQRIGANFLRVSLDCDGTAALAGGAMHFSLLLPPDGRAPLWPRLDESGRTQWPAGADALHRAAYTFVDLDPEAGRFTFDLYLHPGSRTSDWALSAPIGAVAGLTGPGGGGFPPGDDLLLAGDETALPAIRRIIQTSAPGRRITALVETGDPGDRLIEAPAGVDLRWLDRGALPEALRKARVAPPGASRFVWVGAEKAVIRDARAHFRATAALTPAEGYFSWYWDRAA